MTTADADNIAGLGTQVTNQCSAIFQRSATVSAFASIPSSINSDQDMANACGASSLANNEVSPLGVSRTVRVVNAINWCGSAGPGIVGCAYTPGTCLVVRRMTPNLEGILLAHEFGHSKGLPHRQDTSAVMYPSISSLRTVFNAGECSAIRRLGFVAYDRMAPLPDQPLEGMPITDFVQEIFPHGVPYESARKYASADLDAIIPWLSDPTKDAFWSNIISTVAIVADHRSYEVVASFIETPASGALPLAHYDARVSGIISLGYIVKGNGSAAARKFLEDHSTPSAWVGTDWKAPYHANNDARNIDLAAASMLGLSLAGDEPARAFLQQLQRKGFQSSAEGEKVLSSTLAQAISDLSK